MSVRKHLDCTLKIVRVKDASFDFDIRNSHNIFKAGGFVSFASHLDDDPTEAHLAIIFHIYTSYLICLERVALQRKLFFKGPSNKNQLQSTIKILENKNP